MPSSSLPRIHSYAFWPIVGAVLAAALAYIAEHAFFVFVVQTLGTGFLFILVPTALCLAAVAVSLAIPNFFALRPFLIVTGAILFFFLFSPAPPFSTLTALPTNLPVLLACALYPWVHIAIALLVFVARSRKR
ncbi:MAG: hypothetical protein ACTS3F_12355 [Phycisphaerales bacterium]